MANGVIDGHNIEVRSTPLDRLEQDVASQGDLYAHITDFTDPHGQILFQKKMVVGESVLIKADTNGIILRDEPDGQYRDLTIRNLYLVGGEINQYTLNELNIEDNYINLNSDFTTGVPTANAGINVKRGNEPDVSIYWDETLNKWMLEMQDVDGGPVTTFQLAHLGICYTKTEADLRFVNVTGDNMSGPLNITVASGDCLNLTGTTNANITLNHAGTSSDITLIGGELVVEADNSIRLKPWVTIGDTTNYMTINPAGATGVQINTDRPRFEFLKNVKFYSAVDMSNTQINNLANPTGPQDAATKYYIDTYYLPLVGGTITGSLKVNQNFEVDQTSTLNVVNIEDNKVTYNSDVTTSATEDFTFIVNRGTDPNAWIHWDETLNRWFIGVEGDMYEILNKSNILDSDVQNTIIDFIGPMVAGGDQEGITVTYDAADNEVDFDVKNHNITLSKDVTAGPIDVLHNNGTTDIPVTLVLDNLMDDYVGPAIANGDQEGITVTYDAADNEIDFDVKDHTLQLSGDIETVSANVVHNNGTTPMNINIKDHTVRLLGDVETVSTNVTHNNGTHDLNVNIKDHTVRLSGDVETVSANVTHDNGTHDLNINIKDHTIVFTGDVDLNSALIPHDNGTTTYSLNVKDDSHDHSGTRYYTWHLDYDNGGPYLRNESGILAVRNSSNSDYGDLRVENLTVYGNTTSIQSEVVTIADNYVLLNSNATTDEDAGIEVERGGETNTVIRWNSGSNYWDLTNNGSSYSKIMTQSDSDARYVNTTGDTMTGNLTISNASPWLVIDSPDTGKAGISIGESGVGGASVHLTYPVGDGWAYLGMGDAASGLPVNWALRFYYTDALLRIRYNPVIDDTSAPTTYTAYTPVVRDANGYTHSNYMFTTYLNTSSNDTSVTPTHIAVETGNDHYIRWQTPADLVNNLNLSVDGHNHNNLYYTETEADGRFVNITGDTMTGGLTVPATQHGLQTNSPNGISLYANEINAKGDSTLYIGHRDTVAVSIMGGAGAGGATIQNNQASFAQKVIVGNGHGMYNTSTSGPGFYSTSTSDGWSVMASSSSPNYASLYLRTTGGAQRGRYYANTSNEQGFLNTSGNWVWKITNTGVGYLTSTMVAPNYYVNNSNTYLTQGASNCLQVTTNSGYIQIGPQNTTYCHIYTDRGSFYLNKDMYVNGNKVWHAGNDGPSSTLNADLLDGAERTAFMEKTSTNRPGTYQLFRRDVDNNYSLQMHHDGSRWRLQTRDGSGSVNGTVRVDYSDLAQSSYYSA